MSAETLNWLYENSVMQSMFLAKKKNPIIQQHVQLLSSVNGSHEIKHLFPRLRKRYFVIIAL